MESASNSIDTLTEHEKRCLTLELKSTDNLTVFKEYFTLEKGLGALHLVDAAMYLSLLIYLNYFEGAAVAIWFFVGVIMFKLIEFYVEKLSRKKHNNHIMARIREGKIFVFSGRIVKKISMPDLCLVFEDKSKIMVLPGIFIALEAGDFVRVRYLKDLEVYGDNDEGCQSYKFFEFRLYNKNFTSFIELDTGIVSYFLNKYGEYSRRIKWEKGI